MLSNVNDDIKRIVDVFACADGGVDLCKVRFTLEDLEKRDDHASAELIKIVKTFRKLLDVLTQE